MEGWREDRWRDRGRGKEREGGKITQHIFLCSTATAD